MKLVIAALAFCCVEITDAQDRVLPKWADAQKRAPVRWPQNFTGLVQDEQKRPVGHAKLVLTIKAQLFPPGGGIVEKPVLRREVATDEAGRWSISTTDFPAFKHRPLVVVVTASAPELVPWRTWGWNGFESKAPSGEWSTITLHPGIVIAGVCVDQGGRPARGARFRCFHFSAAPSGEWGVKRYECDAEGRFRLLVPKSGQVAYWIVGEDLAPVFLRAPKEPDNNLKYKLKSGARVIGFLKNPAGEPVADAVVQAVSVFDGDIPAYTLPFEIAARTDSKGRFRLPPLSGEYTFRVTSAGELLDGTTFESPGQVPLVVPAVRNLQTRRTPLMLRSLKTVVISGIARWPDKSPAGDTTVAAYRMPDGNGVGVSLGRTTTGPDGQYSLRIPAPLKRFHLTADMNKLNGKYLQPVASSPDEKLKCTRGYAQTDQLDADTVVNFDFVHDKPK